MNSFKITIEPDWLTSGYYLYVASIRYKNEQYAYIGQTGDNNYHAARAPLYRIGGHFAKGVSTENQIIKYFKVKVLEGEELKPFELEQELKKSVLDYTFFKIDDYNPLDTKEKEHKNKRIFVQAIEHYIIHHLQNRDKITVLNAKVKNQYSASKLAYYNNEIVSIEIKAINILKELGYEG